MASGAPAQRANTSAVGPAPDLDEAQLAEFFSTKYAGWTLDQRQDAIVALKDACHMMEEHAGDVKTYPSDYAMLTNELIWLKEHQEP